MSRDGMGYFELLWTLLLCITVLVLCVYEFNRWAVAGIAFWAGSQVGVIVQKLLHALQLAQGVLALDRNARARTTGATASATAGGVKVEVTR